MSDNSKASVWIAECRSYQPELVREAVERLLVPLVGEASLRDCRILVKPNMLSARAPERAVTTNPLVLEATIRFFLERGARVSVGDSPAGALKGVGHVWEKTGIGDVCRRLNVELVSFEGSGWVERTIDGRTYRIAQCIFEFDRIVNLAKAKTHILTMLTGCVKNTFGCVPGFIKSKYHLANPSPEGMSRTLVDVFAIVKPWLNLLDAIVGMEGHGPSSGKPKHLGFLAASRDAVAVDAVFAKIVGIDPLRIPTTREAYRRRLGEARLEEIQVYGTAIGTVMPASFEIPSNWKYRLIPGFLSRALDRFFWVRPSIDDKCNLCGRCQKVCPAGAIVSDGGRFRVVDRLCVGCLCCYEICPGGAMDLRKGWLARFVR